MDDQCDNLIRKAITKSFPDHNIYSEEQQNVDRGSEFTWVVDPLDGTIPYTFGISDHFSVSIALVKKNTPILGVIYAPKRNELYVAEKGEGAFCNDFRIHLSSIMDINKAVVGLDCGKVERGKIIDYQRKLLSEKGVTCTVSYACATVSLGLVASGKLNAYLGLSLEPWDMAAAVVINREAGGKVTAINGKEWEFGDSSIVAANPKLHQKLIDFLTSTSRL